MTHADRMLALATEVADGYSNATDSAIRDLATFTLLLRRELELERQQRHEVETTVRQLMLDSCMRQARHATPKWLTVMREGGLL